MIQHAVIYLLCALGHFQKGLAAVIETQQTVMAAVGEEALLNCQLMQPKDVVRMKWQKVLPKGVENLAFSTKGSAGQVNPDFRDKVEFKYAGLQNTSVVIKNVTEEDEGCYRCVLYTDPDGALTATTCLQLYELHEPVLHVRESNSRIEMFTMIPEVTLSSADASASIFVWVIVVVFVCVAAVIIIWPNIKTSITVCHTETLRRGRTERGIELKTI